jgi:hypothetical protein
MAITNSKNATKNTLPLIRGKISKPLKSGGTIARENKHWTTSKTINLGIDVTETLSDKSVIHYPNLNRGQLPKLITKNQELPALEQGTIFTLASQSDIISRPCPSRQDYIPSLTREILVVDEELAFIQQQALQKMVESLNSPATVTIKTEQGKIKIPEDVLNQSFTMLHVQKSSSYYC